jgi:UDP-glucuronate decarboxylase
LFFDYHRQHQLKIKVARIFNTYGPKMHPSDGRVVSNFVLQALRNESITLYGQGKQTRSFCYVDDMIDGFIRLMNSDDMITGPINLGNPAELSIRELACLIIELTGSNSKIIEKPSLEDDPMQRKPDISKAQALLSWQPTTPLREGLNRTIAYFEKLLKNS